MSRRFAAASSAISQRKAGRDIVNLRPSATAASGWPPAPAPSAGSERMSTSVAAETANESASIAKAIPTPVRLPA